MVPGQVPNPVLKAGTSVQVMRSAIIVLRHCSQNMSFFTNAATSAAHEIVLALLDSSSESDDEQVSRGGSHVRLGDGHIFLRRVVRSALLLGRDGAVRAAVVGNFVVDSRR